MANPYVIFPGTAAHVATSEINLFPDADSANLEQSIGEWIRLNYVSAPLVLASALTPTFGASYLECTIAGTAGAGSGSGVGFGYAAPYIEAEPATAYQFTFAAACDTAGYEVLADLRFLTSGGSVISTVIDTFALSTAFQTFEIDLGTSPALTGRIRIALDVRKVGDLGIDDGVKYQLDAFCVREGADASFVPSINVVGSLYEEIVPADMPVVYVPGSPLTVGEGWAGNGYSYARYDGADSSAPLVAAFQAGDVPVAAQLPG